MEYKEVPIPKPAPGSTKEVRTMRKVIEYVLVSADGVFEDPVAMGVAQY